MSLDLLGLAGRPVIIEEPSAAFSATLSCTIVTSRGAGVPRASALAIASWKKLISVPETKNR